MQVLSNKYTNICWLKYDNVNILTQTLYIVYTNPHTAKEIIKSSKQKCFPTFSASCMSGHKLKECKNKTKMEFNVMLIICS